MKRLAYQSVTILTAIGLLISTELHAVTPVGASARASASATTPAGTRTAPANARTTLNSFTSKLNSLSGEFTQSLFRADGKLAESSSGMVAMQAPNKLRWEYRKPYQQLIVADGLNLWIHDVDLEQVTVRRQVDEEMQSPLAVLVDPAMLDRDYVAKDDGVRENLRWLKLTPKSKDAPFKTAWIGFDTKSPVRIDVLDGLRQKTQWRFSKWQRNIKQPANTFRFVPPKGVDVVGEPVSGAEVVPLKN